MKIHHFDCAPMRPLGGSRPIGSDAAISPGQIVAHCLLVETAAGLVLVDTGFGLADVAQPARIGRSLLTLARPALAEANTAIRQIEALGHRAADVRHVILTHLDVDHAGGISDFPAAQVHVHADELEAAQHPARAFDRLRYHPCQWEHGPTWATHRTEPGAGSDDWHGFTSVRALPDVADILLIPLHGHTRGHLGVAVRDGDGWLLHAGDAYFHRDEMTASPRCPFALRWMQRICDFDHAARVGNQARLRELVQHGGVRVFSAHDPVELARARAVP